MPTDTSETEWVRRWSAIDHLGGSLYFVPGGFIGCKNVDQLSAEVSHLAAGNFPLDILMVFSAIILQRDRMVRKGSDIRRVMEKRLERWSNDKFDALIEEAVKCHKTLKTRAH